MFVKHVSKVNPVQSHSQIVGVILVASTCHRVFPPSSCVRVSCSALIPDFGAPRKVREISDPSLVSQIPCKKWNLKKPCWISHSTSPCWKKIKPRIKNGYNLNGSSTSIRQLETSTPRLEQFGLLFGFGPPGRKKLWEGLNRTETREHVRTPCLEMEHSVVSLGTCIYMQSIEKYWRVGCSFYQFWYARK